MALIQDIVLPIILGFHNNKRGESLMTLDKILIALSANIYNDGISNYFFQKLIKNPAYAHDCYADPSLFKLLSKRHTTLLAVMYPDITLNLLQSNRCEKVNLNGIITCCAINLNAFSWKAYDADMKMRRDILLTAVKNPAILNKLNPPAKILVLATLKKMLSEKELSALDTSIREQIASAYDIKTDYNPEKRLWNKCLWPSMAAGFGIGGIGDYIGRYSELSFVCFYGTDGHGSNATLDEQLATAEVLITDHRFQEHLASGLRSTRNGITTSDRVHLGLLHPRIGKLILENEGYRGVPGEVKERDLELLRQKQPASYVMPAKAKDALLPQVKAENVIPAKAEIPDEPILLAPPKPKSPTKPRKEAWVETPSDAPVTRKVFNQDFYLQMEKKEGEVFPSLQQPFTHFQPAAPSDSETATPKEEPAWTCSLI